MYYEVGLKGIAWIEKGKIYFINNSNGKQAIEDDEISKSLDKDLRFIAPKELVYGLVL